MSSTTKGYYSTHPPFKYDPLFDESMSPLSGILLDHGDFKIYPDILPKTQTGAKGAEESNIKISRLTLSELLASGRPYRASYLYCILPIFFE